MRNDNNSSGNLSDSDDDLDKIDLTGVNFDEIREEEDWCVVKTEGVSTSTTTDDNDDSKSSPSMSLWQQLEHGILFEDNQMLDVACASSDVSTKTVEWIQMIRNGRYIPLLRQANLTTLGLVLDTPDRLQIVHQLNQFCNTHMTMARSNANANTSQQEIQHESLLQLQLAGIAALNLFLQVNYTGPSLSPTALLSVELGGDGDGQGIQDDYADILLPNQTTAGSGTDHSMAAVEPQGDSVDSAVKPLHRQFHNCVLAELAVDGEWPCQVCQLPYWLLVARTLLQYVIEYSQRRQNPFHEPQETLVCLPSWTRPHAGASATVTSDVSASTKTSTSPLKLPACHVWCARAAVTHARLFLGDEPSTTLWQEVKATFRLVLNHYCSSVSSLEFDCGALDSSLTLTSTSTPSFSTEGKQKQAACLVLEWGLAQHFMDRPGKGRISIHQALTYAGLQVELTGTLGKRTKYQQDAIAQLQVKATSRFVTQGQRHDDDNRELTPTTAEPSMLMKHSEDGILLEHVKYMEEESESSAPLSILDQAILLALCLDVKNTNPTDDVLTAEEMGAYLTRVLRMDLDSTNQSPADWMVYATALLERAWLEFESSHSKERALLQLQALADQHSNRLSLTQSTFASVQEHSAPAQDRLRHLHKLVYPPRWYMIRDLAERYAKLGIVTSAAELFLEIEMWDQVVECYKRAGKERLAREIVEQRLKVDPTPRMWVALGDLTKDPQHYNNAIELSQGRFSAAYVALGQHYFEQGSLVESARNYRKALTLRPLAPQVWFRLGTISMQLKDWATALEAFSNVVQQEPEEHDAWANVAAIHMKNKCPEEAYPALKESLKYSRTNWRVWTSQLYTCIDLGKHDEAIQACDTLLDLQQTRSQVPNLEEKCVKAIVGKTLSLDRSDDSTKRTLMRLHTLLDRMSSKANAEPWIWETLAYFHEQVGWDEQVLENLLKEYRALQAVPAWERDDGQVKKVVAVVSQISRFYVAEYKSQEGAPSGCSDKKGALIKCRYLVKGVLQKIKAVHCMDESKMPHSEIERLETILRQVQELTV